MNKTTCITECDTLGNSLKQVHIIIYDINTLGNSLKQVHIIIYIRHQYTWL